MEKLNKGNKCVEHNSFNEIYESHTQLFQDLLQPRLGAMYDYYVQMPEVEDDINNYIQSGTKPICLFSGLTGIGKTSVLNHIKTDLYKSKDVHCIYIDLVGRRANLELGEDFHALSVRAARERSEKIASTYLIRMLLGSFKGKIDIDRWGSEFYNFIMDDEEKAHLIYHLSMHSPNSEDGKRKILDRFREQNPVGHAYTALKYYCHITSQNHVAIILDNTDQKDFELIEAFVNILADFNVCIGREVEKVTSIISCRPYNEKRLQKRREINSLSSHGDRTISLSKPCGIARIISQRKQKGKFTANPIYITTAKGAKWTIHDVEHFIDNLTSRYEYEGLEDLVVELNNYDLSLAFDNTVNILRNKYFISAERLLPGVLNEESELPFGVSRSAVLKSLAYGNPKTMSSMFYPSENSKMPIPNLLNWNPDKPESFLSKFRVIQFLIKKKSFVERNGVKQCQVIEAMNRCFGLSSEVANKCLKVMYFEKLIFTHSNREPSDRVDDYIVLSPRGRFLYQLCSASSLLAEFWFDDTPIEEDVFDGTFLTIKFNDRYSSLVKFISLLWEREKKQVLNIVKQPEIREEYIKNFVIEMASRNLLKGVRASSGYYRTSDEDKSTCDMVANIFNEIEQSVKDLIKVS